jgi:tetratricopeptide (TPR) repeat protein
VFRFIGTTLLVAGCSAAISRSTFEIRGEILPHRVASVSLHAVASPFAVSATAGPDGRFRFKDVQTGTYSLSVSTPLGGDVRKTIEIGPSTADRKGRITTKIDLDREVSNRTAVGTISARAWQIPDRARREYEEALKKIGRRDFEGARACLQRAVDIAPQFSEAWNHLGTMAYQGQHYREAETYFRQGLEANPDGYEPLVNLGGVLINLENFEEALKYNSEAVRRRPEDALAQSQLGMTYAFLNQLDAAEKHLLLSIRLDPDHFSRPRLSLAEVYIRKNEPQRAADELDEFLRRHPDWPTAAKMKGLIAEWRSRSGKIPYERAAEQRK